MRSRSVRGRYARARFCAGSISSAVRGWVSDRCGFCAQRLDAAPVTGQLLLQLCQLRANLMQFGVNLVALGGVLGTLMITRQLLFGGFQRDDLVPAGDSRVQIGSVRGIENRLRAQRIPQVVHRLRAAVGVPFR